MVSSSDQSVSEMAIFCRPTISDMATSRHHDIAKQLEVLRCSRVTDRTSGHSHSADVANNQSRSIRSRARLGKKNGGSQNKMISQIIQSARGIKG